MGLGSASGVGRPAVGGERRASPGAGDLPEAGRATTPPSPSSAITLPNSHISSEGFYASAGKPDAEAEYSPGAGHLPEVGRRQPRHHRLPAQLCNQPQRPRASCCRGGQAGGGGARAPPRRWRFAAKLAADNPAVWAVPQGPVRSREQTCWPLRSLGRAEEARTATTGRSPRLSERLTSRQNTDGHRRDPALDLATRASRSCRGLPLARGSHQARRRTGQRPIGPGRRAGQCEHRRRGRRRGCRQWTIIALTACCHDALCGLEDFGKRRIVPEQKFRRRCPPMAEAAIFLGLLWG